MPAPKVFSLVENSDLTLKYFHEAHALLLDKRPVRFDLSNVDEISPDAIALLVASVNSGWFTRGTPTAGNAPGNSLARKMFEQSGFYDHVQSQQAPPRTGKQHLVHRLTFNKVENLEARDASRLAAQHVYGDNRRIRPLYEVLIECMANTNNHAEPTRRGVYDWWLFVYNDPNSPRTIFTFLDLGVGIFKSLPVRQFWKDPLRSFGLRGNLSIFPKLLAGEISSRTGKAERGKGIPRIGEHARGGTFSRFVMLTNDVYANLMTSEARYLKEPIHGTIFIFEISRSTTH